SVGACAAARYPVDGLGGVGAPPAHPTDLERLASPAPLGLRGLAATVEPRNSRRRLTRRMRIAYKHMSNRGQVPRAARTHRTEERPAWLVSDSSSARSRSTTRCTWICARSSTAG